MKCNHCLTDFHAQPAYSELSFSNVPREPEVGCKGAALSFITQSLVCSKCGGAHLFLSYGKLTSNNREQIQVFPRAGAYPPAPAEVPIEVAADFAEANEVLAISPKASAALARRCLQAVLSAHGYKGRDLVKQVEAAINESDASRALPSALRENIDAVRNFGNFSAHPITDQTTLQVVNVEEGEAEWCLQILTEMFDHYYVAPARAAARRAALAAKLAASGKPPMKS